VSEGIGGALPITCRRMMHPHMSLHLHTWHRNTKGLALTKVERTLVAQGDFFDVECAVRSDLSSPVDEFLVAMKSGTWEPGLDNSIEEEHLEPDEQITEYSWFIRACSHIASTGEPIYNHSYNQLQEGIWEIKHYKLRISFYDTDGSGEYEPLIDYDSYEGTFATRPWPQDFLEYLRLTTAFKKSEQDEHIALAPIVRTEDLEHDRT
jgi:hypothetical protein